MTHIIKNYIDKHYDPKADMALVKRVSYQQARKFQPYYQYLQIDKSELLRNKDEPTGLRNIGNTCYLNIFLQLLYHVNEIRDTFIDSHFSKERLLGAIQNLFGRMVFSKYSYCDTEGVFEELNRVSANKINLGIQYDFHEYLMIQLDNIEKSLKREGLNAKSGVLDKVFCGKYTQTVTAGEEKSMSQSQFGMITLDGRMGNLKDAYQLFKNYKVEGYKTKSGTHTGEVKIQVDRFPPLLSFFVNRVAMEDGKLVKFNGPFEYPRHLKLDVSTNEFVWSLSEEDELLETKISKIEEIMEKQEYKSILESLRVTKKFLDNQSFETVTNADLGIEGVDNYFGMIGSEDVHEQTKNEIQGYIDKLERQEENLAKALNALTLEKRKSLDQKKLQKYSLFALMIHMGSAVSGHYYIYIYNQVQKKWRKYSDRTVEQVTQEQVHAVAQGRFDKQSNVCCIIYKHPQFKCNPFQKPPVPASLKSLVNEQDLKTGQIINDLRVERMVRTCAGLAEEQTLIFRDQFGTSKEMFIQYFSQVVNYYLSVNNLKTAELSRLKAYISEPAFKYEVANQLGLKQFNLPDIPLVVSKDYVNAIATIRKALYFEESKNMESAIAVLCYNKPVEPVTAGYYEEILIIFLLKGCFYLDLYQQLSRSVKTLIQVINFGIGLLKKKSIFNDQLSANIHQSLPNALQYLKDPLDLKKVADCKSNENPQLNLQQQFQKRMGPWKAMYVKIKDEGRMIPQESRNDMEMPSLIEESNRWKG